MGSIYNQSQMIYKKVGTDYIARLCEAFSKLNLFFCIVLLILILEITMKNVAGSVDWDGVLTGNN
jgi:hypothetical protein